MKKHLFDQIIQLVELSGGGALILFTSKAMLQKACNILEESLDFPIFSQLDLGAQRAMEFFCQVSDGILLGTNSFWQGVDIAGPKLRMLIITKLMFTPPEDPIYKARSSQLEEMNKNSFLELALPYANIMLKQGFGRLIRSETDKGVISILDSRIIHKAYGKKLLMNLPRVNITHDISKLKVQIEEKNIFN